MKSITGKRLYSDIVDWAGTMEELARMATKHGVFVKPTGLSPAGGHPEISVIGEKLFLENFLAEYNSNKQ